MAASKRVYWLGEMIGSKRIGGIKVDGKHVSIGESFAADLLSKDRLSAFRKAGCIGDAPFAAPKPVGDDMTLLQGRIKELENISAEQSGIISDLKNRPPSSGNKDVDSECQSLVEENKMLRAVLTTKQKAKIKKLKKDGKK